MLLILSAKFTRWNLACFVQKKQLTKTVLTKRNKNFFTRKYSVKKRSTASKRMQKNHCFMLKMETTCAWRFLYCADLLAITQSMSLRKSVKSQMLLSKLNATSFNLTKTGAGKFTSFPHLFFHVEKYEYVLESQIQCHRRECLSC